MRLRENIRRRLGERKSQKEGKGGSARRGRDGGEGGQRRECEERSRWGRRRAKEGVRGEVEMGEKEGKGGSARRGRDGGEGEEESQNQTKLILSAAAGNRREIERRASERGIRRD